jgi:hypothetical protein
MAIAVSVGALSSIYREKRENIFQNRKKIFDK